MWTATTKVGVVLAPTARSGLRLHRPLAERGQIVLDLRSPDLGQIRNVIPSHACGGHPTLCGRGRCNWLPKGRPRSASRCAVGTGRPRRPCGQPTAATIHWHIAALPSTPLTVPGVGQPRCLVELIDCRASESADFDLEACDDKDRLRLPVDLSLDRVSRKAGETAARLETPIILIGSDGRRRMILRSDTAAQIAGLHDAIQRMSQSDNIFAPCTTWIANCGRWDLNTLTYSSHEFGIPSRRCTF